MGEEDVSALQMFARSMELIAERLDREAGEAYLPQVTATLQGQASWYRSQAIEARRTIPPLPHNT